MTALYAALMLAGHQPQALKSSEIIAKVLAKYAEAKSGVGEFVMSQSAGSKKIAVKTELQFERPSKIYLHQSSETVAPNDWLLVSDGANFGYDVPGISSGPRRRLFEPTAVTETATGEKKILKLQGLFLASKRSLGDNLNPFIEFTTQSAGDNQSLKGFLARMSRIKAEPADKQLPDGTTVYDISGIMNFGNPVLDGNGKQTVDKDGNPIFESAGRFNLYVTKDFELVSFRSVEQISVTDAGTNLPTVVPVVTTWTGKFQMDAAPAASIFTVR